MDEITYSPECDGLWPGSYPFKQLAPALKLAFSSKYMIAHWPQLPQKSEKERMLQQTLRAMHSKDHAFTADLAAGWAASLKRSGKRKAFKTHITGPYTLGITQSQREMKLWFEHARWQISEILKKSQTCLFVIDDPILDETLATNEDVKLTYRKIHSHLNSARTITGVHSCNEVSPAALIGLGMKLVHFDCYNYPDLLSGSKDSLQNHLREGGLVAWGIIPNDVTHDQKVVRIISESLLDLINGLKTFGLPAEHVFMRSIVAPVCGAGMLTTKQAQNIFKTVSDVSKYVKSRYKNPR